MEGTKLPLISIIVPVYNSEKYLNRCIDSILSQTYSDFEMIIVDDGSTDNSLAICNEYANKDKRVKVIHKANGGQAEARNVGIDVAKGDYLCFVDSDDWIHTQMLDILLQGIRKEKVLCSICSYEETNDNVLSSKIEHYQFKKMKGIEFLVEKNINAVVPWAKLYHTSLFKNIRYPVGRIAEDEFVAHIVLYNAGDIAYCNEKLYNYFINYDGVTRLENTLRSNGNQEELDKRKDAFMKRRIDKLEALYERIIFFKDKDNYAYFYSCREYIGYVSWLYSQLYSDRRSYLINDGTVIKMMKKSYNDILAVGNKYEKLYFFMVIHNILRKWIAKNDFEPIQNIIRKIKRI